MTFQRDSLYLDVGFEFEYSNTQCDNVKPESDIALIPFERELMCTQKEPDGTRSRRRP